MYEKMVNSIQLVPAHKGVVAKFPLLYMEKRKNINVMSEF